MKLICINDQNEIKFNIDGDYYCPVCNSKFPVIDGVVIFTNHMNVYEEESTGSLSVKYLPKGDSWINKFPLWLAKNGFAWYVDKYVPKDSTVIELGCGGGVNFFSVNYKTTGIDLSHKSLKGMVGKYEHCIVSDALKIPFESNSVDAVVSSYFWEHIEPGLKPKLLSECRRVLKPGGRLIFLYDVESENPLIRHLRKKNEIAYQEEFITRSHHWGFQSPEENIKLFEEFYFRIIKNYVLERTFLQSPAIYDKLKHAGGIFGLVSSELSSFFSRLPVFYLYTLIVRAVDSSLGLLFPPKWGRLNLTVCEKNKVKK